MLLCDSRMRGKESNQRRSQLKVCRSVLQHSFEEHSRLKHWDCDGEAALIHHPRHGHIHSENVIHWEDTDVDLILTTKTYLDHVFILLSLSYLINHFKPGMSHLRHLRGEVTMGQHHPLGHPSGPAAVGESIH